MSAKNATGRGYITKSKAGHYTVTLRASDGRLLAIQDKQPTLKAARDLLSILKDEKREVFIPDTGSAA